MSMRNEGGGAYTRIGELAYEMGRRGWEVHHISPKGFQYADHRNIIHHCISYLPIHGFAIFYSIQLFFKGLYIVKKYKINVVIAFNISNGFICALAKIFSRHTKLCICLRGDDIAGLKIGLNNKFWKFINVKISEMLEKITLRKADLILFVSNNLRETVIKRVNSEGIEGKSRVIHNNANSLRTVELSQVDKAEFGRDGKFIGYIGLLYISNVRYLIEAFVKVKRKLSDVTLILVGDGPDKRSIASLVRKLNIEESVIFTGFKDNPFPYIKAVDLVIRPTLHEGSSNTILEALYCEIPVLGSKVGGTPEILRYDELLFDPHNSDEMAVKILNLLQNEAAYQRAKELCRERKQAFTFDWAGKMITTIESLQKGG